jgi:peptidoglycan/LPS O-acetylase OafA/YrhL
VLRTAVSNIFRARETLGLIRVFLALCVLVVHAGFQPVFPNGQFAVELFFVISGFYMALVLNTKYPAGQTLRFYAARYLRLYPAYIVVLFVVVAFIRPVNNVYSQAPVAFSLAMISAFSMIGMEITHWFGLAIDGSGQVAIIGDVNHPGPLSPFANTYHMQHMWSVGVEISFYVLAPFFLRSRSTTFAILVLSFGAFVLFGLQFQDTHPLMKRSTVGFLWYFAAGGTAYHLYAATKDRLPRFSGSAWASLPFLAGAVTIVAIHQGAKMYLNVPYVVLESMLVPPFAVLMVLAFDATKNSSFDKKIGELSYAMYVVHLPIVTILLAAHQGQVRYLPSMVIATVLAALLLHFVFERPIDRYRAALAGNQQPPSSNSTIIREVG